MDGVDSSITSQIERSDEKFRSYFWNNFVQEDGPLLYTLTSEDNTSSNGESEETKASFVPFSELKPLQHPEISYKEVTENYKDTIRIVATPEQQRDTVLGYSGAASQISSQALQVLQSITAAREFGATQAQLAKIHRIDPRSMYHFLKVLIEMKLIVKIPVTTDGQYTLLCLHIKFASQNLGYRAMTSEDNNFSSAGRQLVTGDGGRRFEGLLKTDNKKVSYYSGLIKQKLTHILECAKNQAMSIEDLARALDLVDMNVVQNRWFNRQIELLCKLKYIKRVNVPGVYRCIKLIRPYGANMPGDEATSGDINLKSVIADDTPQSGICIDTSIDHQVYKHILDSKEHGIIAKEIRRKMNMLNVKLLARILDTLCKPASTTDKPLINRVVEVVGRERRYRYYSDQGFKSSVAEEHKEYIEKSKTFPVKILPPRTEIKQKHGHVLVSSDFQGETVTGEPGHQSKTSNATGETELVADDNPDSGAFQQESNAETPLTAELVLSTSNQKAPEPGIHKRFISVSLLKRRKIILSILERKRMMEVHQSLVTEYQQEKARLYPDQEENSVIDRKTLVRTIHILESEGLVKVYKVENIPLSGEGTVSKTFCIHPEVDPTSEEVKAFVTECSNRQLFFATLGNKPAKQHERLELEVESLGDMQKRLGQDFFKGPMVPLSDVGAILPKARLDSKPRIRKEDDSENPDYASEFGWNKAKMMRALVFHRFLLDKLSSTDSSLFSYAEYPNVFATAPIFVLMDLRVFLIVVGISEDPTEETRTFVSENRDSRTPLNGLPDFMKPYVVPQKNFKKRLREVLEILDALGLLSPLACAPGGKGSEPLSYAVNHLVLNTHYEIHTKVKAPLSSRFPDQLDYDLENRKVYKLLSPKDCKEFWMDLQSSATVMKYVPTVKSISRPWSGIRRDFLLNLCNKRIWAEPISISNSQKDILMTQVNTIIRFAPPPHDPKIDQMAKETGLPRDHVVQFYKAITKVWHANSTPQRAPRLKQVKTWHATNESLESSIGPVRGSQSSTDARSTENQGLLATSTQERGGKFNIGHPKKSRARRVTWEDHEDDRLLLSYAITRCISETFNYKFSWQCVARAFDDARSREVCRHRYAKLARELTLTKRVESYRAQFSHVLPSISEKFRLDRKLDEYDINPLIAYFEPKSDSPSTVKVLSTPLPSDINVLEEHSHVRQAEPFSSMYIEDRLHPELSLPRRLHLINQLPSTLRTSCRQELDHLSDDLNDPRTVTSKDSESFVGNEDKYSPSTVIIRDETLAIEHTILSIVKAVYCLPRPERPRSVTRAILSSYQSSKVIEACELAKDWKILAGIKHSTYRIPGQRVGRSERFSNLMNGTYPRRLTAAATEINEMYDKTTDRIFQSDTGPAEMIVFLTDIAMGWLELSMVKPIGGGSVTAFEEVYGQGAILQFDISLKNTRDHPDATPGLESNRAQSLKLLEGPRDNKSGVPVSEENSSTSAEEEIPEPCIWLKARNKTQATFAKYVENDLAEDQRSIYKAIFEAVFWSASSGLLLQDIKGSLLKYFYKLFLAVELDDLIEELERRGAVEASYGILPKQASLFSKRSEFKRCDKFIIDERKVTNYIAQPGYYRYLDMSLVVSDHDGADAGPQGGEGEDEDTVEDAETELWLNQQPKSKKLRVDEQDP
ncbi:hypothetical protein BGZ76_002722 [Entomortierella beljakovae]|nr:hypothetical protein BGZ76_002722 [Entomortierella beljakovae]